VRSNERIAKMEAEAKVEVADKTYVAPVRVLKKPVWAIVVVLTGAGVVATCLGFVPIAVTCFGGLAIGAILGPVLKKFSKPTE
jgi:hypothetical protein